jgi:hypothetical protein
MAPGSPIEGGDMANESGSTGPMSVRTMVIAAMATFGVVVWWSLRDAGPVEADAVSGAESSGVAPLQVVPESPRGAATVAAPGDDVAQVVAGASPTVEEAGFAAYVDKKYKYLSRSPRLAKELLERERIAVAINTAKQSADENEKQKVPQLQAELAEADRKVAGLLPPGEVAGYDMLKNSDMDQFQFEDYVGGISNVAPLAEEKKQAILYAKLSNRHRFNQVLETSGLMRGDLTPGQRQAAFASVSRALRESKDGFLQEARQHMHDEEQFTLLSNYENTEYSGELDKLRQIAERGT